MGSGQQISASPSRPTSQAGTVSESGPSGLPFNSKDDFVDLVRAASGAAKSIHAFIEEAPHRANQLCILGGLLVMINGVFGLLNIGTLDSTPMVYIVNAYLIFFGLVTVASEVKPDFAPMAHQHLESWQEWLYEWSMGLKELWGRGLFYLFQGTLTVLSCRSLFPLGSIAGPGMMILGVYFLCLYKDERRTVEVPIPQDDYIRLN